MHVKNYPESEGSHWHLIGSSIPTDPCLEKSEQVTWWNWKEGQFYMLANADWAEG